MNTQLPDLWTCPKCGAKLVTPNMWHSCGKFELEPLFARSEPHVLPLFHTLADRVRTCGEVTILPQKSRIVFMVRVRFLNVVVRKTYLQLGFFFVRRLDNPRFIKIEPYSPHAFGHIFRAYSADDFDAEFMGWLREGYAVGLQKHLLKGKE